MANNPIMIEQATKRDQNAAVNSRTITRPTLNIRIEAVLLPEMTPQFDFLAELVKAETARRGLRPQPNPKSQNLEKRNPKTSASIGSRWTRGGEVPNIQIRGVHQLDPAWMLPHNSGMVGVSIG